MKATLDTLELLSKLWYLLAGLILVVLYVAKLHFDVAAAKKGITSSAHASAKELSGKVELHKRDLELLRVENEAKVNQLNTEVAQLKYVVEHLTKAGENLKEQTISVINLFNKLDSKLDSHTKITQHSLEFLTEAIKEIKNRLPK